MTTYSSSVLLLAVFALAACFAEVKPAPAKAQPAVTSPTPAAAGTSVAEARTLFDSLCFTCHGTSGHGDGPGAAAIDPKPRSFADVAWQDSVTDDHIKKVIVYGGAAVGKSPMMVGQPQLKGNDKVLDGLVQIVRGFKGK
jgi:mono/diheme cytochrome c family protein